jgi:hypothetical protein
MTEKTINIEHYQIDQDTEYSVESVLEAAKQAGIFSDIEDGLSGFLRGGDVIAFLSQCEDLAIKLIVSSKNPRTKWRLKIDTTKIMKFKAYQQEVFSDYGSFQKFPAHKGHILSSHLLKV